MKCIHDWLITRRCKQYIHGKCKKCEAILQIHTTKSHVLVRASDKRGRQLKGVTTNGTPR